MTTDKQKAAVRFCETCLQNVKFKGDINNFNQVSHFLSLYLNTAKINYNEALESYLGYFDY